MIRSTASPSTRALLLPALAALALAPTALRAQTLIPVPGHAPDVDGHDSVALPFGAPGFRTQILVDPSRIGPTGSLIHGLRFRADRASAPLPQVTVPNVTVSISQTGVALGGLSPTFANNVTGTPTVVFQGSVTLPAQTARFAEPQGWDIVVQLPQPYVVTNSLGNLLIDIVGNNPANATPNYYLDAMRAGGSATIYGEAGTNPSFDTLRLNVATGNSLEPRRLSPGNAIDFNTMLTFTSPPGMFCLATDGLTTPGDLGPLGAPTHSAYLVPVVAFALQWQASFIGFYSTQTVNVPNNLALVGVRLYGQSFVVEPSANALGVLTGPAAEVRIGDSQVPFPMQQVDAFDPAATTGTVVDFGFGNPEFGATPIGFDATAF